MTVRASVDNWQDSVGENRDVKVQLQTSLRESSIYVYTLSARLEDFMTNQKTFVKKPERRYYLQI